MYSAGSSSLCRRRITYPTLPWDWVSLPNRIFRFRTNDWLFVWKPSHRSLVLSTIQYRRSAYHFSRTHEFKNVCNQLRVFWTILRPRGRFEGSFKQLELYLCLCHYGMSLYLGFVLDAVSKRSLMVQLSCCSSFIPSVRRSLHVRFTDKFGRFNIRFVSRQLYLRDFGCSL